LISSCIALEINEHIGINYFYTILMKKLAGIGKIKKAIVLLMINAF